MIILTEARKRGMRSITRDYVIGMIDWDECVEILGLQMRSLALLCIVLPVGNSLVYLPGDLRPSRWLRPLVSNVSLVIRRSFKDSLAPWRVSKLKSFNAF
jgi:hypothetical protein